MSPAIRNTLITLIVIVLVVFGLVIGKQVFGVAGHAPVAPPELSEMNTFVYDQGRPLAGFQLVNEAGEPVDRDWLQGHWTFAFLGYTHCPDVCPTTLAMLRQTLTRIADDLPTPRVLLISADPERDTPERLQEYLGFFSDRFHGLTGDLDGLRALAQSMNGVFVHRTEGDVLLVDHSAHVVLINPQGEMAAVLQPPHQPQQLAEAYRQIYQWARSQHPRMASAD
ncbi:SCO family protein [Marinobacter sp. X15-166B]|uniref:SCO family protein n=1 Tax=Marinobacter sp. X15-166B TaxID=1897620 RepID=UPI00085C03F6|nr:SCO family protein [Marinobacter sp. X15-166B]OEY66168.1 electron transporter SenC [Marinobacter sp. X15-166B]